MKKIILLMVFIVTISFAQAQYSYNGKISLGNTSGKWFKLASFAIGCSHNSVSVDFDINYVDTYTALHIDGLIRFRKDPTSTTGSWYYHQYGYLNEGLKVKDLGSGNFELWMQARGSYGHVFTVLGVTQECTVTVQPFTTAVEVNPADFTDVAMFGNINFPNNKVAIGTIQPDMPLTVDGSIHCEEVKVDLMVDAPDYVFEDDYNLRSLEETKEYILKNKHLPEIPSAKDMQTQGVELGVMNMMLLKKIEELTLYQIELLERLKKLEVANARIEALEAKLSKLDEGK